MQIIKSLNNNMVLVRDADGAEKICQGKGIVLKKEEGDEAILKEGTVDFFTFSYYMSNCISADPEKQAGQGNLIAGVPAPHLDLSRN